MLRSPELDTAAKLASTPVNPLPQSSHAPNPCDSKFPKTKSIQGQRVGGMLPLKTSKSANELFLLGLVHKELSKPADLERC